MLDKHESLQTIELVDSETGGHAFAIVGYNGDGFIDLNVTGYEQTVNDPAELDARYRNQGGASFTVEWSQTSDTRKGRGVTSGDCEEEG